ncbi:MAG: hypothetical protein HY841_10230, partial [Bacteroidetes bacterium]|nr:hypothetical protein [Bacteroidota bacterium]
MKKLFALCAAFFLLPSLVKVLPYGEDLGGASLLAQDNVGIGTNTPNASAILEMLSSNKGMLAPRVTTAQRNAIVVNASTDGLLVFDTSFGCFFYYSALSSSWVS